MFQEKIFKHRTTNLLLFYLHYIEKSTGLWPRYPQTQATSNQKHQTLGHTPTMWFVSVSFSHPVTLHVTQNPYSSASSLNSSELFGMKIFFIFIKRQSNIRSIKQEGIVSSISSSASLWTPEKVSFSYSIVYLL